MPVPIGISFGDLIAGINVIKRVYTALQDAGAAASEYQALLSGLQNLNLVLEQLRSLPATSSASQNHYNAICGMVTALQLPIQEVQDRILEIMPQRMDQDRGRRRQSGL
jgi:hypothetical protein